MRNKPVLSILVSGAAFANVQLVEGKKSPKGDRGLKFLKKGLFNVKPLSVCKNPKGDKDDGDDRDDPDPIDGGDSDPITNPPEPIDGGDPDDKLPEETSSPSQAPTPEPIPAPGDPLEVELVDSELSELVPEEPEDEVRDSPRKRKGKARGRKGFKTLKSAQFFCAGDVRNLCDLGDDIKNTCPEDILAACPQCFENLEDPRKVSRDCLCDCEQNNKEISDCFKKKGKGGKKLRQLLGFDSKLEVMQDSRRELKGQGKKEWDNREARAEVANALLRVRDCFDGNFDQVSPLCKAALDKRFREETGEIPELGPESTTGRLRRRVLATPTRETVGGALELAHDDFLGIEPTTDLGLGIPAIVAIVLAAALVLRVGGKNGYRVYNEYKAEKQAIGTANSKSPQKDDKNNGSLSFSSLRDKFHYNVSSMSSMVRQKLSLGQSVNDTSLSAPTLMPESIAVEENNDRLVSPLPQSDKPVAKTASSFPRVKRSKTLDLCSTSLHQESTSSDPESLQVANKRIPSRESALPASHAPSRATKSASVSKFESKADESGGDDEHKRKENHRRLSIRVVENIRKSISRVREDSVSSTTADAGIASKCDSDLDVLGKVRSDSELGKKTKSNRLARLSLSADPGQENSNSEGNEKRSNSNSESQSRSKGLRDDHSLYKNSTSTTKPRKVAPNSEQNEKVDQSRDRSSNTTHNNTQSLQKHSSEAQSKERKSLRKSDSKAQSFVKNKTHMKSEAPSPRKSKVEAFLEEQEVVARISLRAERKASVHSSRSNSSAKNRSNVTRFINEENEKRSTLRRSESKEGPEGKAAKQKSRRKQSRVKDFLQEEAARDSTPRTSNFRP